MPKVSFGTEHISFDLEPGDSLTEKGPVESEASWKQAEFFQALGDTGFGDFLGRGKPLVVVNDAFRPTPTGKILSLIADRYPDFRADFIVACGNHPAPGDEDIATIFGEYQRPEDSQLFFHDSRDMDAMARAGELHGRPVYLNKHLFDYETVIAIGSVEPHYFAGFTGGRKSIIPGLSDIETNRRNHALAVSVDSLPMRLGGNPVAEDLEELLTAVTIPDLYSIQIVASKSQSIHGCFCGGLKQSFGEAVVLAEQMYSCRLDRQYDLVIAEMLPPLDRNLYQLQKAIENCAAAVADGGTIVAVSKCAEGIGNDEFYQLAGRLENEDMVLSHTELDNPPLGIHKLSRIVRLGKRIQVKALTGLKQEILEQVYIDPVITIRAEMQKLKQEDKRNIDILLVRDAGLLVTNVE